MTNLQGNYALEFSLRERVRREGRESLSKNLDLGQNVGGAQEN